jgi:membrane-associated protease RseP (regulator of RpoE activity)
MAKNRHPNEIAESEAQRTSAQTADGPRQANRSFAAVVTLIIGALILFGGLILSGAIGDTLGRFQTDTELASEPEASRGLPFDREPLAPQFGTGQRDPDLSVVQYALVPFLGVVVGGDADGGARVQEVLPGTPAAKAGLMANDLIVLANGERVNTSEALREQIFEAAIGGVLEIEFRRNDTTLTGETTIGALLPAAHPGLEDQVAYLGVNIGLLPVESAQTLDMQLPDRSGVRVLGVEPDSPARRAGIRERDVLVSIDHDEVADVRTFVETLMTRKPGDVVRLMVHRDDSDDFVEFEVALGVRQFFGNIPSLDLGPRVERDAAMAVDGLPPGVHFFGLPQGCPPEDVVLSCL